MNNNIICTQSFAFSPTLYDEILLSAFEKDLMVFSNSLVDRIIHSNVYKYISRLYVLGLHL